MTALETAPPTDPEFSRQELQAALDRGEIVRLLAEVDAGRIKPEDLLILLREHDRRHWWRRLLAALLGR